MTTTIRKIEQADYRKVEELTREAFWNVYMEGCNEHLLVHKLVNHPDYIPELSFVLELDGKIIGSIFYSRSKVKNDQTKKEYELVTFGPVSILPEYQGMGYGRQLISHSIEKAKELGIRGIIIGGFPAHYQKYGFKGAKKYNISMPDKKYYTGIMALPLSEGALDEVCGSIFFTEALEANEQELELFDKTFPPKVKKVEGSQKAFQQAVNELDTTSYEER